ncbi:MAG: hypothetical protein M3O20_13390 [Acidobacteriota bacterium]|nr:hypothetical protein [Acidobacteriota bacterium]
MNYRKIAYLSVVAASTTVALLAQAPAAGRQAAPPATKASTTAQRLTPDGEPDITGYYDSRTATPVERPKELGSKEFYTDQEFKEVSEKLHRKDPTAPGLRGENPGGGGGRDNVQYEHDLFGYDPSKSNYVATKRTSLVVGPEGRIPPMLPEARQRNAARAAYFRAHETDSVQNLNLETRCILSNRQLVPLFPIEDSNTHFQIVQGKGYVAIYQELNHDVRVIPTDGRAHLPKEIRQYQGDSVGHWEGKTLVVDTTNFTDQTAFRGSTENLHLVERYTRVSDDMLLYRFTVEDPQTWDKPWTVEVPWMKAEGPLYEYACTEGNESIGLILGAARTKEAAAAKAAK